MEVLMDDDVGGREQGAPTFGGEERLKRRNPLLGKTPEDLFHLYERGVITAMMRALCGRAARKKKRKKPKTSTS